MIIVTVELHSAITGQRTKIGEMLISNTGESTDANVGDYTGAVMRKPNFRSVTKHGTIKGHRRHDQPVWNLVRKMLASMAY
ncbi:MAG: hypothetical protein E5Y34_11085 [Mesorhizobium sp.]|uniref:hypothetical protein n=1 Tax=Mesorhizobium sp. TaxID=1871066 RepID=UPI00122720E1|nr:hypothetical protein [Mesorhizobium sp.]TIN00992.1 MAG: hypothetical protein E5Y34_11085 [Mesorhizobium sp.]